MTRKEAISWLVSLTEHEGEDIPIYDTDVEALNMAIKALEQEPRWIPVTERLPEEHLCNDGYIEPSDYVLVWGDNGNYGVSRYWGNRRSKAKSPNTYKDWVDLDWVTQKPIAWMPLPQPYKAESEDTE